MKNVADIQQQYDAAKAELMVLELAIKSGQYKNPLELADVAIRIATVRERVAVLQWVAS